MAPMLWMAVIASVMSLPYATIGLVRNGIDVEAVGALFMLGAMGTGVAFAIYGVLLSRAGTVRGMIGIFFTPIVGTILGVAVRGDTLHPLALVGMVVVILGAVMVSRPEPIPASVGERLLEIGDEVGGGFDADGQAQQVVRYFER
jgi:drug/metabolite transporter (DMT)-like permease